ncbi:A24 family peptidase [Streptomyces sp. NPDC001250]|uniref:prepilin peptidase n=1 Tax=unclassified Streptomyces TaxID=2593676 RepID=UPI00332C6447
MSHALLWALAALWGAAAGVTLPRAAYRFTVPAGEHWRDRCARGHALRGWLGPARCAECARADTHLPEPPNAAEASHAAGASPAAEAPSAAEASHAAEPPDAAEPSHAAEALPAAEAVSASEVASASEASPAAEASAEPPHVAPAPPTVTPRTTSSAPSTSTPRSTPASPTPTPPQPPSAPLLSLATALACAALAVTTGARPELAVWLLLVPVGVLLAVIDFRVQRLPDPLTLPLAAAALALLGLAALLPGHAGHWLTALYGALALGAGYFVLFLINPAGMGFGDVKLAVGMGAVLGWYGWATVLLGTFAGFLLGAVYGGALLVVRRAGRKTAIAFGPFLIAGAFLGLLAGAYAA